MKILTLKDVEACIDLEEAMTAAEIWIGWPYLGVTIEDRAALVARMWRTAELNVEAIEQRLAAVPSTDRTKMRYLERVNYFGQQVRLDVQGRILIPQILRESASVNGDVVVSGQLNHLVVWNHERFVSRLSEQPFTDEDFEPLRGLGLTETEIMDVVLAVTARCFFSKTLDALRVRPDAGYAELDAELREALVVGRPIAEA